MAVIDVSSKSQTLQSTDLVKVKIDKRWLSQRRWSVYCNCVYNRRIEMESWSI